MTRGRARLFPRREGSWSVAMHAVVVTPASTGAGDSASLGVTSRVRTHVCVREVAREMRRTDFERVEAGINGVACLWVTSRAALQPHFQMPTGSLRCFQPSAKQLSAAYHPHSAALCLPERPCKDEWKSSHKSLSALTELCVFLYFTVFTVPACHDHWQQ